MISRLLIANRGEIAVRIARTASAMGIGTVGVYSEADRNALHVDYWAMDVAVFLGTASPAESYLRGDVIIEKAVETGCDAIHPGYGFLAENAAFAQQVIDAGLIWVGPTPDQIALLGDKVAAKRAAVEAGVPTTPVHAVAPGSIPDDLPMPALVKAAAGGGGRGMRVVRSAEEMATGVEAAAREAEAAFGDGTVFVESYIERGRHIEVQIMGDSHGNVVHLGERECSIQRRNQKVIEEAPSPGISDGVRAQLFEGALALARHVGYQNAGTVEFLVGDDESITFLEVNTRLQVEHPVTEAVTGLDLVELQLRVAAGEALPVGQADISVAGHAIEARLVAEDPAAGWIPSTGDIDVFQMDPNVRVDTGVRDGSQVTPHYDSLLAKVIAHGHDRPLAIRSLLDGLNRSVVVGPSTNLTMLRNVLTEEDFFLGETRTSYLAEHGDVLLEPTGSIPGGASLLVAAVLGEEHRRRSEDAVTGFAPSGWRNLRTRGIRETWRNGETVVDVEYTFNDDDEVSVLIGPWPVPDDSGALTEDDRYRVTARLLRRSAHEQVLEIDGVRHAVEVSGDAACTVVRHGEAAASWSLAPRFVVPEINALGSGPISPLPGTVIAVHVEPGQAVGDGDLLVVVEAMKMEHSILATSDGVVAALPFGVGDRVDAGDLLVEFAEAGE